MFHFDIRSNATDGMFKTVVGTDYCRQTHIARNVVTIPSTCFFGGGGVIVNINWNVYGLLARRLRHEYERAQCEFMRVTHAGRTERFAAGSQLSLY
jgi:hypothetical protein